MTNTIATIELDHNAGTGELYLQDGTIWCRQPDGESYSTSYAAEESNAADIIAAVWGNGWQLEWTL